MAYLKGTNPAGQTFDWYNGVTNGDDTIIGNAGKDWIFGNWGNDTIKGGGGADYINGEMGRDTVLYGDSTEGVEVNLAHAYGKGGTAEGDIILGVEDVVGSAYNDKLIGNWDDNRLEGGGGSDILKGGGGYDVLVGGLGDDVLQIDDVYGQAHGGEGIDTLVLNSEMGMRVDLKQEYFQPIHTGHRPHPHRYQATGIENVAGSEHADEITGNDLANLLNGRGGHDELSGGKGNDLLFGETGNDTLHGGTGLDTLNGGAGQDTFVFKDTTESMMIVTPMDVIQDFQKGQDKIDLSQMDYAAGDFLIVNNQEIDGVDYSYFGVDTNHNGELDILEFAVAVKMTPGTALTAGDFLL
jgi:Ca2+-binding RTX toxin-like protein